MIVMPTQNQSAASLRTRKREAMRPIVTRVHRIRDFRRVPRASAR